MNYSVVIRTCNSGDTFERCLSAVTSQILPPAEIVVVDSGSTDSSLQIAERYHCRVIHYPESENYSYSRALNLGIGQTLSEFTLILSSHSILTNKEIISGMYRFFCDIQDLAAVSLVNGFNSLSSLSILYQNWIWEKVCGANFGRGAMSNACALIRKADWENFAFEENLPGCEDQSWAWYWLSKHQKCAVMVRYPTALYLNTNKTFLHRNYDDLLVQSVILGRKVSFIAHLYHYLQNFHKWIAANKQFKCLSELHKALLILKHNTVGLNFEQHYQERFTERRRGKHRH